MKISENLNENKPIKNEKILHEFDFFSSRKYINTKRWTTYAKLIECVLEINPTRILEIGPGNLLVTKILKSMNYSIKTLDIKQSINPDFNMDVRDDDILKLRKKFDLIICSQTFEHIPYSDFLKVLKNLSLITQKLVITLPYTYENAYYFSFSFCVDIKRKHTLKLGIGTKLFPKRPENLWHSQHYWEIGKKKQSLRKVKNEIKKNGWLIEKDFFNDANPYHYFFILTSKNYLNSEKYF